MFNFKFWIFNFDFNSLFAFIVGIFLGFALLLLIYMLMVLLSIKREKHSNKINKEVDEEEIKEIIKNAQIEFKDKKLKGAKSSISHCYNTSLFLVKDISRKFFPKSKRPFAELTIDEILRLAVYFSNRINELIDRPALRLVKKVKLSTILSLGDAKKVIDASSLMKLTKKYKLRRVFSFFKGALNIVNPVYWIKRIVVNTSLDFAIKKICLAVIGIVGEETYKIYSKRVFDKEMEINTGVEDIILEVSNDLKEISDEEIESYLESQNIEESLEKKKKKGV